MYIQVVSDLKGADEMNTLAGCSELFHKVHRGGLWGEREGISRTVVELKGKCKSNGKLG